jgi:hypothetical protein
MQAGHDQKGNDPEPMAPGQQNVFVHRVTQRFIVQDQGDLY